jgi:hypothetical protein
VRFNFENGDELLKKMGSSIVGIQKVGKRPISITLDFEDFKYLLGSFNNNTTNTIKYINSLYKSLQSPSARYDGHDLD